MTTKPSSCLKRTIRSSCFAAAIACLGLLKAAGQQADSLEQQLRQLKQQYLQTTHDLEQRIAALERQIQDQKAIQEQEQAVKQQLEKEKTAAEQLKKVDAVPALELAAKEAAKKAVDDVWARYQGHLPSEPTYEYLSEADQKIADLQQQLNSFEFHGYLRSGYGLSSVGGQQVGFQAPGSGAKYRLGNEAETYGEFIFVNNWLNPEHSSDKAWMKTVVTVEANTTNSASYANSSGGAGSDQFRLREAFVQAGDVLESQPDAKFWAGERYYRRRHIEINDFYSLDMSGYGAGVEDLNLGFGKMALAYLAGARPDIVTGNGTYAKSNIDVRLYGVKGPGGLWGGWFDFANAKGGTTPTGTAIPASTGYAFDVRQQQLEWHGGFHSFSIAYGTGAASNFSTSIDDPTQYVRSSARFLATEQVLLQPNDRFAIMPILVYQRLKDGNPLDGWRTWLSFGVRPEVFFTKYLSLAAEVGADHTYSRGQYDGWLRKFTIAPQIGAGRKFEARPVLRLFLTYADWSDGFRGLVGGISYLNKTAGLSYGVQAETWW
jgi:maltoporin